MTNLPATAMQRCRNTIMHHVYLHLYICTGELLILDLHC